MTRRLRYFVRLDARGRIIPSSLISRPQNKRNPAMPGFRDKGKWKEIFTPICCNGVEVSAATESVNTYIRVRATCGLSNMMVYDVNSDTPLDELVLLLNKNFGGLATWKLTKGKITTSNEVCPNFEFTIETV